MVKLVRGIMLGKGLSGNITLVYSLGLQTAALWGSDKCLTQLNRWNGDMQERVHRTVVTQLGSVKSLCNNTLSPHAVIPNTCLS